jgi:hypothetical protein
MFKMERNHLNPGFTFQVFVLRNFDFQLCSTMAVSDTDSSDDDADNDGPKYRQVTVEDQKAIFYACRSHFGPHGLKRGILKELAIQMGFERKTISRQWNRMKKSLHDLLDNHPEDEHTAIIDANSHKLFFVLHGQRRKGKYKYDRDALKDRLEAVTFKARRTRCQLAVALQVSLATAHWLVRPRPTAESKKLLYGGNIFHVVTSKLKPALKDSNKVHRFLFCASQVKEASIALRAPVYEDQMDRVHVDEKWFWLCKDGERYILAEGEEPPQRYVCHKCHIEKVMFLCAQARPRLDPTNGQWWDGKLGIWAIGDFTMAQRNSVNSYHCQVAER